jgi:CspA family cold shock protein
VREALRCAIFTFAGPGLLPQGQRQLVFSALRYSPASHFTPIPTLMLTGTVKFYNDTKGFGFIVADDNQEEIFVHQTGLIHEIQEGDRVQFNIKAGKKGPNAVEVTRIV